MSGFIKLFRDIQYSQLWNDKPYDRARAWIDLLFEAEYTDTTILRGNQTIDVPRGSMVKSLKELSQKWGWTIMKTRIYIDLLQKYSMIDIKTTNKYTRIDIVNYNFYQDSQQTKQHSNNKQISNKYQTNRVYIDKEVKEIKEENKEEIYKEEKIRFGKVVLLKPSEYQNLKLQISNLDALIEKMNDYCLAHGKKYKDYAAALRTWAKKDHNQPNQDHPKSWNVMKNWAEERKREEERRNSDI